MANVVYPEGKDALLTGEIDLLSDAIKVALLTDAYTYNAAHNFHDDLTGIVATSAALGSKTVSAGVFDAADVTFTALTGSEVERWVLFKDTGTSGTSPLIAFFDTKAGATPISFTPSGVDYIISWSASGIFSI